LIADADPTFRFDADADPDPTFQSDADQDPDTTFQSMRIRIWILPLTFPQFCFRSSFPKLCRSATLLTTFKSYSLATQAKEWLTQCTVASENTNIKKVGSALYNSGVRG
jgi:hypothetical protein